MQVVVGKTHALGRAGGAAGEQQQRQIVVPALDGLWSRPAHGQHVRQGHGVCRWVPYLAHYPPRPLHRCCDLRGAGDGLRVGNRQPDLGSRQHSCCLTRSECRVERHHARADTQHRQVCRDQARGFAQREGHAVPWTDPRGLQRGHPARGVFQ